MKIKLLDEPYLKGIMNWEASMALDDKITALVEEGKLPSPLCFIPLPTADGTLAEVSDLSGNREIRNHQPINTNYYD